MIPGPGDRASDVVDLVMADHRSVADLLADLESDTTGGQQRRRLAEVAVAELVRHSVAEEQYLYPAVREALADGDDLADRGLAAHVEAEAAMKRLLDIGPDDPDFDERATEFVAKARVHMRTEEEQLLPRLRQDCEPGELRRLAVLVGMAKESAPTRPHPRAPHRPPWNLFVAPSTGIVDHIRDTLSGRPTTRDDLPPDDEVDGRWDHRQGGT